MTGCGGGGAPFTYAFQCTSLFGDGAAPLIHEQTPAAAAAHHVMRR